MKMKLQWGAAGMKWGQPLKWGQEFIDVPSEVAPVGALMESQLGSTEISTPVLVGGKIDDPVLVSTTSNQEIPKLGKAG